MANENPTGRGSAVALTITADQVRFLRSVFRIAQDGIQDELENNPKQLGDPEMMTEDAKFAFGF